ncbi:hypothetical protein RhiJN_09556 [Ceratobasidium sp. AG-Ba]|nr:hypothetical protein RhiJN_09556 [Ceratobasidium sp. AG-Ba]
MDQPLQKKQKFVPSGPARPSNGAPSQRTTHSRSKSVSHSKASTPSKRPRATSVYLTPDSARKSGSVGPGLSNQAVQNPDLTTATVAVDLESIVDPESDHSDGEKASNSDADSSSSSKSGSSLGDEEVTSAEPAAVIELLSSSPPRKRKDVTKLSQAQLDKTIARLQAERDRRAREPSEAPAATSFRTVVMSSYEHGQKVAVNIGEGEGTISKDLPDEDDEKKILKRIINNYVRDVTLGLCKLDHVNKVNKTFLYNENATPKFFDNTGTIIPHLDLSFDEDFDGSQAKGCSGWGKNSTKSLRTGHACPGISATFLKQCRCVGGLSRCIGKCDLQDNGGHI